MPRQPICKDAKDFASLVRAQIRDPRVYVLENKDLTLKLIEENRGYVHHPYVAVIGDDDTILLKGTNAVDLLGEVFTVYEMYGPSAVRCVFTTTSPDAVVPHKSRTSDVGYDLTVISEHKRLNDVTALYDTGIQVSSIEPNFYLEVVPRSSLSKSGYMLSNSMGIIDPSYTGNIFVALTRVDPDAKPITFPFRCCQLIVRPQYHLNIDLDMDESMVNTARGAGGFGSTG